MANRRFGTHEVASLLSNYSDMSMYVEDNDSDIMNVDLVTSDDNDSVESDQDDDESDTDAPVIDGGWRIWLPNDVDFLVFLFRHRMLDQMLVKFHNLSLILFKILCLMKY